MPIRIEWVWNRLEHRLDDGIRTANMILSMAKKESAPTDGIRIETYAFDVNLSKTSRVERTTRET